MPDLIKLSPTIKIGSTGDAVVRLQTLLQQDLAFDFGNGCTYGKIDGDFGVKTKSAVKVFQKAYGLASDGICGSKTWAKLNSLDIIYNQKYVPDATVVSTKINYRLGNSTDFVQLIGCPYFTQGQTLQVVSGLRDKYAYVKTQRDGKTYMGFAYSNGGANIRIIGSVSGDDAIDAKIKATLEIIQSCIGGWYVLGGQGTKMTTSWLNYRISKTPDYFTGGRKEAMLAAAAKCEAENHWNFPEDFAWDCSGLWWYAADKLDLFGESVKDSNAHYTYHSYCNPITKSELRAGDCCFYENGSGRITHMAIVGWDSDDADSFPDVYEAMSGYVGVVQDNSIDDRVADKRIGTGTYKSSIWNRFGRPKCFA